MSRQRRIIFLIGLPACGKTTLGNALAASAATDCPITFADLDHEIEAREGISVSQIFNLRGEPYFRALESSTLRLIADTPGHSPLVIACGGGTPCSEDNIAFMLSRGLVVELRASRQATIRRLLEAPPKQRPLVAKVHGSPDLLAREIEALDIRRRPWYARAHASFDSTRLETPGEVADTCARFRRTFNL
ncbi:MAG: shikimate kinase [Muribaculaceae bacterium]|nr:shikimate kinase [Muribaculaceae bacterium]